MKRFSVVVALVLVCVSCQDIPGPEITVEGPQLAISDGAHGGNPHFYFLPPLAPAFDYSGVPLDWLEPRVWVLEDGVKLVELDASLQAAEKSYHVNWSTGDFDLDPAKNYRITVMEGEDDFVLGGADVALSETGSGLMDVNTGEYIPLKDGRTLPVRFRVEVGALPIRILAVDLESTTITINGPLVYYWYRISNPTSDGLCIESGPYSDRRCMVTLQAMIEQGTALRGAAGYTVNCDPYSLDILGHLPVGTCEGRAAIVANDQTSLGWGTFVPGPATEKCELKIRYINPYQPAEVLQVLQWPIILQ